MNLYPLLAAVVGGEIIDLVGETGPVAKVVLLILLIFSLVSWAIILSKWSVLRRARVQSGRFVRAFRKAQRLQDVGAVAEQFRPSPLVGVFEGGFEEYRRQGAAANGVIRSPLAIQRAMQIANSEELSRFERNMPWLAITGAVTPFVGLFGTVWGIIDAFHGLGTAGSCDPARRRTWNFRGADYDGRRTGGCHPGCHCLQLDRRIDSRPGCARRRLCHGSVERGGSSTGACLPYG